MTTRALSQVGFAVPGMIYFSDAALAVLAAITLLSLVWSWKKNPLSRPVVMWSALGVAFAYLASEASKLVFQQARPCGRWPGVGICDLSDYSFPSNHATLAFGAVVAISFAVNKVSIVFAALLLAVTVAAARILEGAHYLHDVAAGAVLGILVPGLTAGVTYLWSRRRARSRGVIE